MPVAALRLHSACGCPDCVLRVGGRAGRAAAAATDRSHLAGQHGGGLVGRIARDV